MKTYTQEKAIGESSSLAQEKYLFCTHKPKTKSLP